uniref:Reverse transcriptase domain-containing protein n=1 Tax=Tanacetum cinerariifolium TaxID=118510 RepID=A0A699H3S4_TANCI|nr:reverse transcriptase domain-containing protein [Tanacetum cinerariifolium]
MRTRNSYFLNNSSVTILRRRSKRRAPNVVEPELRTIVEISPMADNRTMEGLLQAPTKRYGETIVIPEINADHFEIKTNLLQLVQANPYHGFERENPHTHINNFKRITSTLKFRDVPNDVIKHMMFSYSLEGLLEFELTQIDTFYNGLNENDQDSLNAAAGGNLLIDIFAKKVVTPATVKAVEESCVTCGGNHAYYNCDATNSNQSSVCAAMGTYDQVVPQNRASNFMTLPGFALVQNNSQNRLNDQKLLEKATNQMEKFFQIFQDLHLNISFADALLLMPKFSSMIRSLRANKDKLFELAKIPLNKNCSVMLLKKLSEKLGDPDKFIIPFVDFEADTRVPLILGRSFLRTGRALIDVYGEEITLWVNDEAVTFNPNQTTRYSSTYDDMSVNRIDVISVAREEYDQEILGFSNNSSGGNPTSTSEPIISDSSPSITPFEGIDFILEEIEAYLNDDSISPEIDHADFKEKSSIKEPSKLELKDLPSHLEYAYLEGADKLPVIIAKDLKDDEKSLFKGWRVCIDYRMLNDVTRKDHFPLPFMDQMLERLAGNEFYYFLDGFSGYIQIPINLPDQEKTTFTCLYGTFAYRRMPFGLCNAPGTFQRCMMMIFHDMIEKTMKIFMDDLSVFGDSFSSCLSHLDSMLQRCEDTNLVLNWEKCHFMVKTGIVLGHKILKNRLEVDRAKVDTVKGVRSFLGHASFYQRFIQDFSMIARPMTHLLEKETLFVFSKYCIDAFETLKKKLTEASILVIPDWNLPFELMCDACDFAIGAILGQPNDILKACHEGPTGGHHGANFTAKKFDLTILQHINPVDYFSEEEDDDEEENEHLASADSTAPTPSPPTHTSPTYADAPLGYRAAMIRLRVASPLPIPSPRLLRARLFVRPQTPMVAATEALIAANVPEANVPPQKRLCLITPAPSDIEERAPTTLEELSQRVTDLDATLAPDTHEMDTTGPKSQRPLEIQSLRMYQLMLKTTTIPMTDTAIKALIAQGIVDALVEYEAHRSSGNGNDSHDFRSGRRTERAARECTYSDFLKCQPLNFKGEVKKLDIEIWNLKVKGTDVVEKYVGGLRNMIQGSVMASKPKTMQDAIELGTKLMDQKIRTFADRPTLLGLVRRKCTEDLNLYALNVTTVTMGSVHQGATIVRKLAIWPVIVGYMLLMLMLILATKETPRQIRGLSHALSVEFRALQERLSEVKEQELGKSGWE